MLHALLLLGVHAATTTAHGGWCEQQAGEGVRDLHEALLLRNGEYQSLLARTTTLEADKRELAAQAAELRRAAQAAQVSSAHAGTRACPKSRGLEHCCSQNRGDK